ncbi:MAG: Clp protease ClpP [Planctomycetes bacterium]|nr:Clp protease ClpP [Planctomycetota bacterium]
MPELKIYDDIGADFFGDGVTAKNIDAQLAEMSGDLTVRINSYGGDVFEGHAIYNLIKGYEGKTTVIIDGIAASAASVIAMAGDEVVMPINGMLMIHDPWTFAMGDSKEMTKTAEVLDQIKQTIVNVYEEKTNIDSDEIAVMMSEETWLDADQANELGFAIKSKENSEPVQMTEAKRWINKAPQLPEVEPETKPEPELKAYANADARKRILEITAEAI